MGVLSLSPALIAGVGSSFFFVILNVMMNLYMKWLFTDEDARITLTWLENASETTVVPDDFKVSRAWYGDEDVPWGSAGANVTAKVVDLLSENHSSLKASSDLFGDPAPGRPKMLIVSKEASFRSAPWALPWSMLAMQQLEAYVVLQPWLAYATRSDESRGSRCGWGTFGTFDVLRVIAVTLLFCFNVGLNTLSLAHISLTLNQTVRAFLPVGVLLLASCIEQRTYALHSYLTTVVLVMGIALTCFGSPDFDLYGFSLAFASTLVAALGTSLNGLLLSKGPFGGDGGRPNSTKIMQLMLLQSIPACFIFSLIAVLTEGDKLRELAANPGQWEWSWRLLFVSISSALALLSNLGRCFLVASTSALMESLAGNCKVAMICIIDNRLFGTSLRGYNYIGIALTFAGFSLHVLLQYAQPEPPVPVDEETAEDEAEEEIDRVGDLRDPKEARRATTRKTIGRRPSNASSSGADETDRGRRGRTWTNCSLSHLNSAADTGLVSEHFAVQVARLPTLPPIRERDDERHASMMSQMPPRRMRSTTWQAGTSAAHENDRGNGFDMSLLFETPLWLDKGAGADDETSAQNDLEEDESFAHDLLGSRRRGSNGGLRKVYSERQLHSLDGGERTRPRSQTAPATEFVRSDRLRKHPMEVSTMLLSAAPEHEANRSHMADLSEREEECEMDTTDSEVARNIEPSQMPMPTEFPNVEVKPL